jgi:soluble lytic murein transglycosylase-like protein
VTFLKVLITVFYIGGLMKVVHALVMSVVGFALVGAAIGGTFLFMKMDEVQKNQVKASQFILSNVSYAAERQNMVLFCRDRILSARKDIPLYEAFDIASVTVKYSEIYPDVDALLLLAIETCESKFDPRARSSMNALGLIQVLSSNGRIFCKASGIQYSDSLLFQIDFNMRVGCQIFECFLNENGNDAKTALVGYNGGNSSIKDYKAGRKLNDETDSYTKNVISKWNEYRTAIKDFRIDTKSITIGSLVQ